MKVKINDEIYDSNLVPILLYLEDSDKQNISTMEPDAHRYLNCPDTFSEAEMLNLVHAKI